MVPEILLGMNFHMSNQQKSLRGAIIAITMRRGLAILFIMATLTTITQSHDSSCSV